LYLNHGDCLEKVTFVLLNFRVLASFQAVWFEW
jgi:hypothetical protein